MREEEVGRRRYCSTTKRIYIGFINYCNYFFVLQHSSSVFLSATSIIFCCTVMKMSVASSPLSFIINANSTMPMYSCSDCSYKTSSLRKLGRHKSVNHAGVKYRCEHCDFVTGYQSNYYRHRKQVRTTSC